MSAVDSLPLAVVLAALLWSAGRVVAALVEGRSYGRRDRHLGELLHHVDAVSVAVRDAVTALDCIAEHVGAVRDAAEQHITRT